MAGPDPSVIDPFINSWKTAKQLEGESFPPGAAYWASVADTAAKAVVSYLEATLPPLVSAGQTQLEAKAERRRKILEMWEEFDRKRP